jgi:uncharacterized damage-inducible protein DinB
VIPRPGTDEYAPFYAGYVAAVPDGDLLAILRSSGEETRILLDATGEEGGAARYAEGKWSVRQVVGHLADAERILVYRALRIARGDATPLAAFDENAYALAGGFDRRTLRSLADELERVRASTLDLFRHLDGEALERWGTASGAPVTVRALAWIVAGHEFHHRRILRERYGLEG